METITGVHRNHFGEIISFVTSGGRIISYRKALMDAENGILQGVKAIQGEEGTTMLAPETHSSFDDYPNLF